MRLLAEDGCKAGGALSCLRMSALWILLALPSTMFAQLTTISSFPYEPSDTQEGSHFVANYDDQNLAQNSVWTHDEVATPRQGSSGPGDTAWAVLPNEVYESGTITWLHSPKFDFTGQSGLELKFEVWITARSGLDGMKLQVSTNGGSHWSDVDNLSVGYHDNSEALVDAFGGESSCWSQITDLAETCALNLNPWSGMSDVRFRWCFAAGDSETETDSGPVIDSPRVVYVAAATAVSSGFSAIPQGKIIGATITKDSGDPFTTGMTVQVSGTGLSGTVTSVVSDDECTVDFTATRIADVGAHTFWIKSGSTNICQGTVAVYRPHQLIPARETGSLQEPPQSATMGANSVYLHNGEFRHDLPFVATPGRMLPIGAGGTYRSQLESLGWLGAGWTASFDQRINYDDTADEIELYSGSGRRDVFELASGGTAGQGPYIKPGFFFEIARDDNSTSGTQTDDIFTITYAHGSTAKFLAVHTDTAGRLTWRVTRFEDRYGNANKYTYDSCGFLILITGDIREDVADGRVLSFTYNSHGRLATITDHADYSAQGSVIGSSYTGNREWEFDYNSDAQLVEIKLPKTERYYSDTKGPNFRTRVQFTYDSNDRMLEVIDARQANESTPLGWLSNHYDGNGAVDYQDVGRTSSSDTTHRQHIVYGTVSSGQMPVNVINAEAQRSEYLVQVSSGSYPIGTAVHVRHYTATWSSALSQIAGKVRSTDPNYYETSFEYDDELNLIKSTYPRGNVTEFRYDIGSSHQTARGNLLRVLSDKGSIDGTGGNPPHNLPTEQVNGLLATFTYTEPPTHATTPHFNLLKTSVSPRAYVLGGSYDIVANTGITTDDSSEFTTTYTYNTNGTLQKVTSPEVSTAVAPDTLNVNQELETTYTYNSFGQLETVTDQANVETTYVYGTTGFSEGYLTQVQFGTHTMVPLVTQYAYNSVGQVISVTDPKSLTYTSYVNQLDQVVRSETPPVTYHGNAVYYSETKYDLNGNVEEAGVSNIDKDGTLQSPSLIKTSYQYNILDMATSVTEDVAVSVTRTTQVLYDKIFRAYETILPEGNRSGTDFDEMNRTYKTYFGYDGTTVSRGSALIQSQVDYDENSNVVRVVDGRSNESTAEYDAFDRLIKSKDRLPTDQNWSEFVYNAAGQITSTSRHGWKRSSSSPWTNWTWSDGQLLAKSETEYDNIGRAYLTRSLAKDAAGNDLGYSTYESPPTGAADGWSTSRIKFRSNGQVEETENDLRVRTRYEYDDYNRLEAQIDDRSGGGPSRNDDNFDFYDYDANGNVVAVTAHLWDEAIGGSGPHKVLQTTFTYDSLNRLVADGSPTINGQSLSREYRYDSRSNRVWTQDRKSVERFTTYDLLNRPIRFKVADVAGREINPSTGLVSLVSRDIVNRTVYDKNSNTVQAIDSNGNRTYLRYDLANRWLQTQYPDGGTGTPLKSTAGDGHSIAAVSGTPFFSKSGAYDGNSNLLKRTDANGTVVTYTYDENDNRIAEVANTTASSVFGIIGETGRTFSFDGLYRSAGGTTVKGNDDLTATDFLFNTLSRVEAESQKVFNPHPYFGGSHDSRGTVLSRYDELGRRYSKENAFGSSRTYWKFDRKNRPVETYLQRWDKVGNDWHTAVNLIDEYKYVGGGLLHSKQIKYHPQDSDRPVVSTFTRDDLLRVTSVRHIRDDSHYSKGERVFGRFDTAFDNGSMMRYEARWYEEDDDGASTTPDSTDFFFYRSDNKLDKVIFDVTKDGNEDATGDKIDLSSLNWSNIENHRITHSDRMIYARRDVGTRSRVNWYRGTADKDSSIPASFNEANTAPHQKTHYETTDDPSADPDNPAADGAGSRHNYTTIGQIGYTYDNNRNMLADGTREFRYNYLNQLRRVWRKSDGAVNGLISEYAEDAFGRRVLERSWWELSRRVYFDTRFELDVDLDANGSSTDMELIDGGMASSSSSQQTAEWHTRIYRDTDWQLGGIKYYDYLVEVPEAEDEHDYLGFVGVKDVFELRIFGGYYKLWRNDTSEYTGTYNAPGGSTAGFRNIGFTHARDVAAFIDGVGTGLEILWAANPAKPMATFGSLAAGTNDTSLKLLENLNYLRGFLRGECTGGGVPRSGGGGYPVGGPNPPDYPPAPPVTTQPVCDAMQKSAVAELVLVPDGQEWTLETNLVVDYQGSPDRAQRFHANGSYTDLYLVSTSRRTAVVVRDGRDAIVQGEEGLEVDPLLDPENPEEPGEPTFGVAYQVQHGAGGQPQFFARLAPDKTTKSDWRKEEEQAPTYEEKCMPQRRDDPPSDNPPHLHAQILVPTTEAASEILASGSDADSLNGEDSCACNGEDVSQAHNAVASTDTTTGMMIDYNGGDEYDPVAGVFTGGPSSANGYGLARRAPPMLNIVNGIRGWDPDDAFNCLNQNQKDELHTLWKAGWRFATSDDGSKSISGIDMGGADTANVNIDVTNDDWAQRLAGGADVQWESNRWAVDFDNKMLYIDAHYDCSAAEIIGGLMDKITAAGGNIDNTDFHINSNGWAQIGGGVGDPMDINGITDQRRWSQLGYLKKSSLFDTVTDAFNSFYGPELVAGMIGGVGAALALRRLYKIAKIARKISEKLDYMLGKGTGSKHNINRSKAMLRSLQNIGLDDTPEIRKLLKNHFQAVLRDPSSVAKVQANGRTVRESLLMGPRGGVKVQSIWDGEKLLTMLVLGGG